MAVNRADDLDRLYAIPDDLRECHGRLDWPRRGVYFFFEPGEVPRLSSAYPTLLLACPGTPLHNPGASIWISSSV